MKRGEFEMKLRLIDIEIRGFKDSENTVKVHFTNEQSSTIYGVNGSGKTTLLRILQAIFSLDEDILIEENVNEIVLKYANGKKRYECNIYRNTDLSLPKTRYIWENIDTLSICKYIYVTTDRGLNTYRRELTIDDVATYLDKQDNDFSISKKSTYSDLSKFVNEMNMTSKCSNIRDLLTKEQLSIEYITIDAIEQLLLYFQNQYKSTIMKELQIQFLNTAVSIYIPKDKKNLYERNDTYATILNKYSSFQEDIKKYESFFYEVIKKNKELLAPVKSIYTFAKDDVESFIANNDLHESNSNNYKEIQQPLSFLTSVMKLCREQYYNYYAVDRVMQAFSNFTNNKEIQIDELSVNVQLKNKTKHELNKLSNGERHLLTFLSVLGLIGIDKDVIMIDEPGISMDTDWQEILLQQIQIMCPNSQIIVTTHSPDISDFNPKMITYLE